jgi:hypothetical protein
MRTLVDEHDLNVAWQWTEERRIEWLAAHQRVTHRERGVNPKIIQPQ